MLEAIISLSSRNVANCSPSGAASGIISNVALYTRGYHYGEDSYCDVLSYATVLSGRRLPMFQRNSDSTLTTPGHEAEKQNRPV